MGQVNEYKGIFALKSTGESELLTKGMEVHFTYNIQVFTRISS